VGAGQERLQSELFHLEAGIELSAKSVNGVEVFDGAVLEELLQGFVAVGAEGLEQLDGGEVVASAPYGGDIDVVELLDE